MLISTPKNQMLNTCEYQKIQFAQISYITQRNKQKARWITSLPHLTKKLKYFECTHSCSGETPGDKGKEDGMGKAPSVCMSLPNADMPSVPRSEFMIITLLKEHPS